MEPNVLLSNSIFCRLCCEKNTNGIDLFRPQENSEELYKLVNKYLPVKIEIEDEELFPKTICPGCHIQLEATRLFMDLIIEGQEKLRALLKSQIDRLNREEKERKKLQQALQNHNSNASVETYTIQTDQDGEKYIIQIFSEGPLFSSDHQLALRAEGLDKPKRKRGRPPKVVSDENVPSETKDLDEEPRHVEAEELHSEEFTTLRHKRKIKPPTRYEGVVEGKELAKILKKEGVIDEEIDVIEHDIKPIVADQISSQRTDKIKTVIGKVVKEEGQDTVEELIFMKRKNKAKNKKGKKKGFSEQKYSCNICKKEFQHYGRCEMHKRTHKLEYGCQSENCHFQNEDQQAVVEHQKERGHEGISVFEKITKLNGTVVLAEEGASLQEVQAKSQEQEGKFFQCNICGNCYSCKQNFEVHLKAVHDGQKPFKCKLCSREFAYACSLKNHMVTHKETTDDTFQCNLCKKNFQHMSSLVYHKEAEHGSKKFICNKCQKCFRHRQLLLRHQLVHSSDRPFKCSHCERQFKSKTNLMNHENIHNGNKKFACPICKSSFLHKTSLLVHLKWHDGKKPFRCDVCKKTFSQKGNLLEHQRIHTGEKPFSCAICGRSFTTSSQCKLHVKRHTGDKPYSCKYCPRSFLHKDSFDSHVRRHLGERPFECNFCKKAFTDQWACTRHERIHLGIKKYKCEICDKAFTDCTNYNKHKKIHTRSSAKVNTDIEHRFGLGTEEDSSLSPQIVSATEEANVNKNTLKNASAELQVHDLLDPEGNIVRITTADGQPIPIVSSENEKLQGLLPDGTLVSFDILAQEQSEPQEEPDLKLSTAAEVSLLNTDIPFLEENAIASIVDKPTFISEDGKVCFLTSFDDNSFLIS